MHAVVMGSGPSPARVMVVGERPGEREAEMGRGFVGPSGEVLWQFFAFWGVNREECYVTNLDKSYDPENADPTEEGIKAWGPVLDQEIATVDPHVIVAMGRFSYRYLTGDPSPMADVSGIPVSLLLSGKTRIVIPVTHPAAGLYVPRELEFTFRGLRQAARLILGTGSPILTPPEEDYHWGLPERFENNMGIFLYMDTEGTPKKPFAVSVARHSGEGYLLEPGRHDRDINELARIIRTRRPIVVLHHAVWDLKVLKAMGIDLLAWGIPFEDTMLMAFAAQDGPAGLKPQARRLAGMKMTEYIETFMPYVEGMREEWFLDRLREFEAIYTHEIEVGKRVKKIKRVLVPGYEADEKTQGQWRRLKATAKAITENKPRDLENRHNGLLWEPAGPAFPEEGDGYLYGPEELRKSYAAKDPAATAAIHAPLAERINDLGTWEAYKAHRAIIPTLVAMEERGLRIDRARLNALNLAQTEEMETQAAALMIWAKMAGMDTFTPSNPAHIADLVYNRLRVQYNEHGYPDDVPLTDTGQWSTDDSVLKKFRHLKRHPALDNVVGFRKAAKLIGTYTLPVYDFIGKDERVRARFKLNVVPSGRMAAEDPNLLAWPEEARAMFVASDGMEMGSWDLDQIEMRLLASESQDERLMKAFIEGIDIHGQTASLLFGVPYKGKLTEFRDPAKVINYMIVYGGTATKLLELLEEAGIFTFNFEDGERLLSDWFRIYSGVRGYMDAAAAEVMEKGYVTGFSGRIRYLPGAVLEGNRYPMKKLREQAIRQAGNHKIQEGATYIFHRTISRMGTELPKLGIKFYPLLPIHDENVAEFELGMRDLVDAAMRYVMTADQAMLRVPLLTSSGFGEDWSQLK